MNARLEWLSTPDIETAELAEGFSLGGGFGVNRLLDQVESAKWWGKEKAGEWLRPFACERVTDSALDVKLLGVECGIALDEDVAADELFKFGEPAGVV